MTVKTSQFGARSLAIETAEGILFSLPLAGPITRFLAWLLDTLIIVSACGIVYRLLSNVGVLDPDLRAGLAVIAAFLISMGYGMVLEWLWRGQTLGKRALGLRVVDASGRRLQPAQIIVRNLMRSLDSLPGLYLVGGAALLLTRNYQRLGDLVSNTVVIRRQQISLPELTNVSDTEKYNSFLDAPHFVARLRANTSPELAHLAYWALQRRNDLSPEVRIEILRQVSRCFRAIVEFPQEITFALTDERYVRNALGVLTAKNSPRKRAPQFDRSKLYEAP